MRLEYLPAQIIIISSRHLGCVAGESPPLPYTTNTNALGGGCLFNYGGIVPAYSFAAILSLSCAALLLFAPSPAKA